MACRSAKKVENRSMSSLGEILRLTKICEKEKAR